MKIFRYAESSANIQIFVEITVENSQYDINKNLFELFKVNMKTNSLSWRQGIRHTIVTNNRCTAFHKEDYHLCLDSGIRRNHIFFNLIFQASANVSAPSRQTANKEGASDSDIEMRTSYMLVSWSPLKKREAGAASILHWPSTGT